MDAAQPKEIPMTKQKSKRQTKSHSNAGKIKGLASSARTTARQAAKPKLDAQSIANQRSQSSSQAKERDESKRAQIIAMLRAPGGATIEAMAHAAGWQQHSVRGFLAGVIRKKLDLKLESVKDPAGRVYRITDHTALPVAAAKTSQAA